MICLSNAFEPILPPKWFGLDHVNEANLWLCMFFLLKTFLDPGHSFSTFRKVVILPIFNVKPWINTYAVCGRPRVKKGFGIGDKHRS